MTHKSEKMIVEVNGIKLDADLALRLLGEERIMDYFDHEQTEIEEQRSLFKKQLKAGRKPARRIHG